MGITILNEQNEAGGYTRLSFSQGAVYLHVDDTLAFTSHSSAVTADAIMTSISEHMEAAGFLVPERYTSDNIQKAIGYQMDQGLGRFSLPLRRQVELSSALLGLSGQHSIDVEVLRSVLGIFMFGAQLRRETMSVPHACYRMVEVCANMVVPMWASVRAELKAMSRLVPLLFCDTTCQLPRVAYASDAMGAGEGVSMDHGGFGVVISNISEQESLDILESSEICGRALCRDNLLQRPGATIPRELAPTIPFTRVPHALFAPERWLPLSRGRWRHPDHITLGEARAVIRSLQIAATDVSQHHSFLFNFEDNMAVSGSFNKGRSSTHSLNYLCRKRAAWCLVTAMRLVLPWVETVLQPADGLSRVCQTC
jgi:hypothetical protein